MRPFVVNGHGRLVFPSNFSADLDFSVLETLEQLEAVVKRDFEAKAPTGTEILERVEAGDYDSRSPLLRDLAMNLVWGNRYAMTMYEKRPTRWRDLPRDRDDVFLPLLTPWEQGERKVAAVETAWGELPATWDAEAEDGIFSSLFEIFRHKRHHATELPPIKPTVAEITSDPHEPHLLPPAPRPGPPAPQLPGDPRLQRGGPRARAAAPPGDGAPEPVPVGPRAVAARGGRQDRRRRLRRRVRAAQPRGARVHPARAAPSIRARPRPVAARRGDAAGRAAAADRRARAVRADAAARVADGRQGRARLHERGHRPQRRLQLVADERRGHRGQDGHPRAALHRAPARAHRPAGRPRGARGRRPPAGGDRRGHLLLLHEHDADPVRRDLALRPARDLPDPRLVRPHRRLRGLPLRRSPRRCGCCRRSSGRCSSSAPRSSRTRSAPSARRG